MEEESWSWDFSADAAGEILGHAQLVFSVAGDLQWTDSPTTGLEEEPSIKPCGESSSCVWLAGESSCAALRVPDRMCHAVVRFGRCLQEVVIIGPTGKTVFRSPY